MSIVDLILDILHAIFGFTQPPPAHKGKAMLNGSNLFCDEYTTNEQFKNLYQTFCLRDAGPFIRTPFPPDKGLFGKVSSTIDLASKNGINVCILLDCYFNDQSMKERINFITSKYRNVRHFELFNESPQCKYPGEQLSGLNQLIAKTNEYADLIHKLSPGSKVLSMAPVNSLSDVDFGNGWESNGTQLERLIKETRTDIAAIHLYVPSSSNRYNFRKLMNNLEKWMDGKNKKLWVTETGYDNWDEHVNFYYEWTSRFWEYLNAERVIWYRQTINSRNEQDGEFALESKNDGKKSPLCEVLKTK